MDRRTFLLQSLMAGAAAALSPGQQSPDGSTVTRTAAGELRGSVENGLRVFRGVPFAQPPVGPLRFKAPQPAQPWTGVREALQFAPAAMQTGMEGARQSEDCLHLNLWAPPSPGPHPVFVWIHGGGFTGGRSSEPIFNGASFARQGIVCVTVAYRLGVFGFLDFGPVLGPEYAGGANNALQDLILALEWVQTNVAAFGGDPRRVTIGGESAGAKLTDILMGIPSAQPMFQQMISESGGAERVWAASRAAEIAHSFATVWSEGSGSSSAALKDAPAADILAAQKRFVASSPVHFPLRAEIDGTLIPRPPLDSIRAGSSKGKRLLIGTNRDESALFIGAHPDREPGPEDLGNLPVAQFRSIEEQYKTVYPDMPAPLRRIRSVTAEEYWVPSLRVVDAHVGSGGAAFVYRFDFAAQGGRYAGEAFHSEELAFVWDHQPATATTEAASLTAAMHDAWCSFILGGAPAAKGLPAWPAYSTSTRPTMLLDSTSRVEASPQRQEFALWNGLLMH